MKTLRMTNNCSKWVDRRKPQNRVVKYIIDKTVDVCLEREQKAAKNSASDGVNRNSGLQRGET